LKTCGGGTEIQVTNFKKNAVQNEVSNNNPILQVDVFRVMTPGKAAVVYQYFGQPCCLHIQGENLISHSNPTHNYLFVLLLKLDFNVIKPVFHMLTFQTQKM
jgi:hypothetical protein